MLLNSVLDNLKQEVCLNGAKLVNQEISRHLFCELCKQLFIDPMRLSCGHTFCQCCIIVYQNQDKTARLLLKQCPHQSCKKPLNYSGFQRNILASNLINDLEVYVKIPDVNGKKHIIECTPRSTQNVVQIGLQSFKADVLHAQNQTRQKTKAEQIKERKQLQQSYKRIQILDRLANDPEGALSVDELQQRYLVSKFLKRPVQVNIQNNPSLANPLQNDPLKHLKTQSLAFQDFVKQVSDLEQIMKDNKKLKQNEHIVLENILSFQNDFQKKFFAHMLRTGQQRKEAGINTHQNGYQFVDANAVQTRPIQMELEQEGQEVLQEMSKRVRSTRKNKEKQKQKPMQVQVIEQEEPESRLRSRNKSRRK